MDHTSIHPSCTDQAHRVDLHLWRGAPQNLDASRPVQILVNDGYVVGFCPERLQPAWSAYRVALAGRDLDFERPLKYYDDMRLPEEHRIGQGTFGRLGGVRLNVGHMAPNEVINRQFGRLAQLETFLMSNMSPQYQSLNQGVWARLERAIREIEDEEGKDHVWVIVGPIFGEEPASIYRGSGKYLPVPDSYFCVVVDPHTYPYDTRSRVDIDCFIIRQDAPSGTDPDDYPATLEEIEAATHLRFFEGWGRDLPVASVALAVEEEAPESRSRIMKILRARREAREREITVAEEQTAKATLDAGSIDALIGVLRDEAIGILRSGRALDVEDLSRLRSLQHTITWLLRARDIAAGPGKAAPAEEPQTLITYKIERDLGGKLKQGARTACNFWNRHVQPARSIVIRLGLFTENSQTIAAAWRPYEKNGVHYGQVKFNTKYLSGFEDDRIAGTIVHEIGHSLGIGWRTWNGLFDENTGIFKAEAIGQLEALRTMEVELDGGDGTALSHWDEARFDKELMTGYQDDAEHVLPVTIDVMEMLGHRVISRLEREEPLADLLHEAANVMFARQEDALVLDRDYYEPTELMEVIPHPGHEPGGDA